MSWLMITTSTFNCEHKEKINSDPNLNKRSLCVTTKRFTSPVRSSFTNFALTTFVVVNSRPQVGDYFVFPPMSFTALLQEQETDVASPLSVGECAPEGQSKFKIHAFKIKNCFLLTSYRDDLLTWSAATGTLCNDFTFLSTTVSKCRGERLTSHLHLVWKFLA